MIDKGVLVTADWVEEHLDDPGVVVVEADEDHTAYRRGHIRNAVPIGFAELQDRARPGLVDAAGFARLMSRKGITADDLVVIYGKFNVFAAYLYWCFRLYGHRQVRLLDGGRTLWEQTSRELVTQQPARAGTDYRVTATDAAIRAFRDDVLAAVTTANLVDCRSPEEYSGKLVAPSPSLAGAQRPGHIPAARNVSWSAATNNDGTFRSEAELRELYLGSGVDPARPTITYCWAGVRSAHTWFALHELLGLRDVRNYDGSWAEYGSLVGVPIERGDASPDTGRASG